jgi:hypothetical protein
LRYNAPKDIINRSGFDQFIEEIMINFKGLTLLTPKPNWAQNLEIIDFSPPFLLRGGDLQTMANRIIKTTDFVEGPNTTPIKVSLSNGHGDALVGLLDHPDKRITGKPNKNPLVLMVHGLGGEASSVYCCQTTGYLLRLGYSCLRLNMRGAGPSAKTSRGFYHAGKSDDLRDFIKGLPDDLTKNGVFVAGYSLGANITLKMLGEPNVPAAIIGAVAISPPISLKSSQLTIDSFRNFPYLRYLMDKLRVVLDNAQVDISPTGLSLDQAKSLKKIWDFDDKVIAPLNCFKGADDYYNQCSCKSYLKFIKTPTLIVHAATDPWIPPDDFIDSEKTAGTGCLMALINDGGHVGFHQREKNPTWHDQMIANLLGVL